MGSALRALLNTPPQLMSLLDVSFNQDQGCFAIAHENGFMVYNSDPVDLRVRRTFLNSNGQGTGIACISMLHRTNYLAMVGGGRLPKFPENKVIIWDDLKRRPSLNLNLLSPVLNVLLSRVRIVVVLRNLVVIYEFIAPPRKIASFTTIDNPHGIADLSAHTGAQMPLSDTPSSREGVKGQILAFPGRNIGQIQLVDVSPEGQEKNSISIIKGHKSKIRCLALNSNGTMIASASETGTIIRVHLTQSTALIVEFRRGLDKAVITGMRFSPNSSKLAVISDKNTLHVFNILGTGMEDKPPPKNKHHALSRIRLPLPLLDYFQSTWSFCSVDTSQYHVDPTSKGLSDSAVIGWLGNETIILVWKVKNIWERYVITSTPVPSEQDGNTTLPTYSINRVSWKKLD